MHFLPQTAYIVYPPEGPAPPKTAVEIEAARLRRQEPSAPRADS